LLFEGSSSCLYSVDDDAQGITSLEGWRPYDWKMTGFKAVEFLLQSLRLQGGKHHLW